MDYTEGLVRIVSDGLTRQIKLLNPVSGEEIKGVCGLTIKTHDDDGELLPMPVAMVDMYARADVLCALKVLPREWPFEDAKNGVLP